MALELKGVVEAQQAQLKALTRQQQPRLAAPGRAGGNSAASAAAVLPAAASAKPHIAQLQRLVQDMRTELRQPPPMAAGIDAAAAAEPATWADGSSTGGCSTGLQQREQVQQQREREQEWQLTAMGEELAGTQQRLRQLQAAHDSLLAAQVCNG